MRAHLTASVVSALAVAGICLTELSCTAVEETWDRFDEPVVTGELLRDGNPVRLEECFCDDLTYAAVPVTATATFTTELDWHERAELVLSACVKESRSAPAADGSRLEFELYTATGTTREVLLVPGGSGWTSRSFDLGPGGGHGRMTLDIEVPPGCELYLRDLYARSSTTAPAAPERPPQVLLISVDTLRNDALDRPGSPVNTPNLARFAAESEQWDEHYSGTSWTKPSHATLLTGVPTWVHGALSPEASIRSSIPTLAERFREGGFATGAIVFDCGWLMPKWGFDRGFDQYYVERWRIDRQIRQVANWVHDHRDSPFFFFLHSFDVHSDFHVLPYEAPGVTRESLRELFAVDDYGCRAGRCASTLLQGINLGVVPVEDYDARILRHTYDAGVRHTDEALGELFDSLRRSGLWDQLLVVLTSDHGEAFFEHGFVSHKTLHQEVLRVPLLVKWPGGERAGTRNPVPSSSIDVAPTILEACGLETGNLPGTHLERRSPEQPIFAGDYVKTVISRSVQGIFGGADQQREVYRLAVDPGEQNDLSTRLPGLTRELRQLLHRQVREDRERFQVDRAAEPPPQGPSITPEERARLEALGYLQ